jgi:hypothetical protein
MKRAPAARSYKMKSSDLMRFRVSGWKVWTLLVPILVAFPAHAAEVWDGPLTYFTNYTGSDPTQPASQDRITPSVWITRGSTRGIYNAAVENSYTHHLSPIGTEWAYGELTNYDSLIYNT